MGLISNGNTVFDNGAMASGFGGSMVLVSSATASASATIDFTLGSYKEYQFYFVNIHPASNNYNFQFNFSTDSGSNYNVTKTSTFFHSEHDEANVDARLTYQTGMDLAQSTSFQQLDYVSGNDTDANLSGIFQLFNPSSTTYVKHFIATANCMVSSNDLVNSFVAGYANTTSALTNIRFQMNSGNIDDGTILMFGIV
jgi:hypothetical protein